VNNIVKKVAPITPAVSAHQLYARVKMGNASHRNVVVLGIEETLPWNEKERHVVKIRSWDFLRKCEIGTTSYAKLSTFLSHYTFVGIRIPSFIPDESVLAITGTEPVQHVVVLEFNEKGDGGDVPIVVVQHTKGGRLESLPVGKDFNEKFQLVAPPPKRRKDAKWRSVLISH
jgi:hypothetical protein